MRTKSCETITYTTPISFRSRLPNSGRSVAEGPMSENEQANDRHAQMKKQLELNERDGNRNATEISKDEQKEKQNNKHLSFVLLLFFGRLYSPDIC